MASGRKKKKAESASGDGTQQVAANRKARFHYHFDEKLEVGLALLGTEVKAIRAGAASLTDCFVRIRGSEAYLVGCHIGPYKPAGQSNHDPMRERKLLLHRRELDRLEGKVRERGLTLLVTRLYLKNGRVKAELVLARGKRAPDKRAAIKERVVQREMDRAMKRYV